MDSHNLDEILWRHIASLPYFRGFLRAVEDRFYQDIPLNSPVLDLGSGDGHFASAAFEKKLDVGLDPWWGPMREARRRGTFRMHVLGEGARIPFAHGSFQTVTCTSVLEHIADVFPVLLDTARVLKDGGIFVFCVPNHRFPESLWGRRFFIKLGLSKVGEAYSRFFNRISRHEHTDPPDVWESRLKEAGFNLLETWDYFPPTALHILEWGHPLGLPSLILKKVIGRWILVPQRWNLVIPWKLTRRYMDNPKSTEGVYSFFIAQVR